MSLSKAMLDNARRLLSGRPSKPLEARAIVNEVLRTRPDDPEALSLAWDIAQITQDLDDAAARFSAAAARLPNSAGIHHTLALALFTAGKLDKAEIAARRAVELESGNASFRLTLANILHAMDRQAEAAEQGRKAAESSPSEPSVWCGLASLLERDDKPGALDAYQRANALRPGDATILLSMGRLLHESGRMADAEAILRKALAAEPRRPGVHASLGTLMIDSGRSAEGWACLKRAIELDPDSRVIRAIYVMILNYVSDDGRLLRAEHREYGRRLEEAIKPLPPVQGGAEPDRRLRVGFLSGDMRSHSCMHFLLPPFEGLDRSRFDVFGVSASSQEDAVTERFKSAAQGWISVVGLPFPAAAARIRDAGIDVLIECHGHTVLNRLDICAAKPAPLQMTFLGYPNTTGLKRIDYRLVDALTDPPGAEEFCEERLLRIPECLWCFRPFEAAPPVVPTPAARTGRITFGSFNNLAKIGETTVAAWAGVLGRVPSATLLLKNKWIQEPAIFDSVRARFAALGVDPARIRLAPYTRGVVEHLHVYDEVDIQLDPFPYNGTTTTCESLWQGVPVLAVRGRVHAAKVSESLLHAVGLDEWIAPDTPAYIEQAAHLAADIPRLNALRMGLRDRMSASALRDEVAYSRRFGDAIRQAWREHCGTLAR